MTEAEWRNATDPHVLLRFVLEERRATDRQLRLLACAWCRQIWNHLPEPGQRAVEAAERFADGEATTAARLAARRAARHLGSIASAAAALCLVQKIGPRMAEILSYVSMTATFEPQTFYDPTLRPPADRRQADAVRDIVGNPFRPPRFDPRWRTLNTTAIARALYAERRFGDLPILAEALHEAGCADDDVLAHGRLPQEHFRGCWLIDGLVERSARRPAAR